MDLWLDSEATEQQKQDCLATCHKYLADIIRNSRLVADAAEREP